MSLVDMYAAMRRDAIQAASCQQIREGPKWGRLKPKDEKAGSKEQVKPCSWPCDHKTICGMLKEAREKEKPLKDWTLGEMKEFCGNRECGGCSNNTRYGCRFHRYPNIWDLSDPPRFTQEEVERAKALLKVIPDAVAVNKGNDGTWAVQRDERPPDDPWPSIKPGETVKISDIIGGEHE